MSDLSGLLRPPVPVLAAVVAAAVVVVASRCRRVAVHGASMAPALLADDRLLLVPAWRLRTGDVVALRDPRDPDRFLVKRVATVDREAGRLTVLGDNPGASTDSRAFGAVPRRAVLGRAVYRYAPMARAGRLL
jgi:nickel-type superoxide dismutase maturation protease